MTINLSLAEGLEDYENWQKAYNILNPKDTKETITILPSISYTSMDKNKAKAKEDDHLLLIGDSI